MSEKSTGCASATEALGTTEVAEIGREAGIVDGKAGGVVVGTEAGVRLTGGFLEAGAGGDGRLRASATMLAAPDMWRMSEVNSAM
jgi:hypothetical protein